MYHVDSRNLRPTAAAEQARHPRNRPGRSMLARDPTDIRLRGAALAYWRALRHGTAYLGFAMIAVIWVGVFFHLASFKSQLFGSVRQNAANLARAFEEDVVHSLREVDWTIQLLRQNYLRPHTAQEFADLTKELNNVDGLTLQYVVIGPDGIMAFSSAAPETAAGAAPLD